MVTRTTAERSEAALSFHVPVNPRWCRRRSGVREWPGTPYREGLSHTTAVEFLRADVLLDRQRGGDSGSLAHRHGCHGDARRGMRSARCRMAAACDQEILDLAGQQRTVGDVIRSRLDFLQAENRLRSRPSSCSDGDRDTSSRWRLRRRTFSTRSVLAPCRAAARAATIPAQPPPQTRTSVSIVRREPGSRRSSAAIAVVTVEAAAHTRVAAPALTNSRRVAGSNDIMRSPNGLLNNVGRAIALLNLGTQSFHLQ
jgi:hypothetical protein